MGINGLMGACCSAFGAGDSGTGGCPLCAVQAALSRQPQLRGHPAQPHDQGIVANCVQSDCGRELTPRVRVWQDLVRERGTFGDDVEEKTSWMLDVIEGPARMRKRMCRCFTLKLAMSL